MKWLDRWLSKKMQQAWNSPQEKDYKQPTQSKYSIVGSQHVKDSRGLTEMRPCSSGCTRPKTVGSLSSLGLTEKQKDIIVSYTSSAKRTISIKLFVILSLWNL